MTDRISEIRARHEAATSGEWRVHESHNWHKDPPKEYFILAKGSSWVVASWVEKADAEAIVNAHNDILCLLDLIEVMQAENTEMYEWYTLLQKNCNAQFARAEEAEAQLKAAVEDARQGSVCRTCHYLNNGCEPLNLDAGCHKWQWRDPQEAGEERKSENE